MNWNAIVGPATLVYLVSITIGGVWWASDLSTRVATSERRVEAAASAAERFVRLETLVSHVDAQLNRIEDKLDRREDR